MHRTGVAQSADLIRVPSASQPIVNATLLNLHVYCLPQISVSTWMLDGLLLAIALCIVFSFLINPRKVLIKNPTLIAAATSPIAEEISYA